MLGLDRKNEIKEIIIGRLQLQISIEELKDDTPLFSDEEDSLGLDSVEVLEIIGGLEDHFDIVIESGENPQADFYNVNAIDELVTRCKEEDDEQ